MEKQYQVFIGIIVVIVAITVVLFYMGGTSVSQPGRNVSSGDNSHYSFSADTYTDEKYLTFRYTPDTNITGPVTATYQVEKDNMALIRDKKIFESVSPGNPIEIVIKKSENGTYTTIMLISDGGKNLLHKSSTSWYASNATSVSTP